MSSSAKVIIALLALIAVGLGVLVVDHFRPSASAGPLGGGGNLIALTGNIRNNGDSILYVVDSGREAVVVYQLHDGRDLFPVSIRSIAADLDAGPIMLDTKFEGQYTKIPQGAKAFAPKQLRDDLEKMMKTKKETP